MTNIPAPAQLAPDNLVFDIGQETTKIEEVVKPPQLKLYNEHHPLMHEAMPQFDFSSTSKEEIDVLVKEMFKVMRTFGGVGLSCNQVGVKARMFVMDRINPATGRRDESMALACFNPEVIRELEPPKALREGCLSFPGLSLQIKRPAAVEVRFEDENGELHEMELEGVDAQCFQHELDHMNGIVFTKKVDRQLLDWERGKQKKLLKKMKKAYGRFAR